MSDVSRTPRAHRAIDPELLFAQTGWLRSLARGIVRDADAAAGEPGESSGLAPHVHALRIGELRGTVPEDDALPLHSGAEEGAEERGR